MRNRSGEMGIGVRRAKGSRVGEGQSTELAVDDERDPDRLYGILVDSGRTDVKISYTEMRMTNISSPKTGDSDRLFLLDAPLRLKTFGSQF